MKNAVVLGTAVVCLAAGIAFAAHHEKDTLIALDKEWGSAAPGQAAVDAITRIIDKDVVQMSGSGITTRADLIEEAKDTSVPATPYLADSFEVKFLTDDIAVMTHHAGEPDPHWSLHVWQKKGDKWVVVASGWAPETED